MAELFFQMACSIRYAANVAKIGLQFNYNIKVPVLQLCKEIEKFGGTHTLWMYEYMGLCTEHSAVSTRR